jgi:hypothetical protein
MELSAINIINLLIRSVKVVIHVIFQLYSNMLIQSNVRFEVLRR